LLPKTPLPTRHDEIAPHIARLPALELLSAEGLVLDDADVVSIAHLYRLHTLRMRMTAFPDNSLGRLSALSELETLDAQLYLTYSAIDPRRPIRLESATHDVPERFLERMHKLRVLNLGGRAIGDRHVQYIQAPGLKSVSLDHTEVTDGAVEWLVRMPCVTTLSLNVTHITEAGALKLAELRRLESVGLAYTDVTDAVIGRLACLPALKELRIGNLKRPELITAGAIIGLRGAPTLERLYLHGVHFTAEQIRLIKSALPGVFVDCVDRGREWMTHDQHYFNTTTLTWKWGELK
jgi:hypothetical protein